MAADLYELECMRAELLGLEKPNKEQIFQQEEERKKAEQEELENQKIKDLEYQDQLLNDTGGKLDELNSILSRTQKKLNKFKQTLSGSLLNINKNGSFDRNIDSKHEESQKENNISFDNSSEYRRENIPDNKETIQSNSFYGKAPSLNIQQKMTSHIDKLDKLILKADQAECSMIQQNKQMKKAIRK